MYQTLLRRFLELFHEDKEISKWQYCTNPPAKEKAYFRTLEARTEKELEKVEKEDTMFYTRSEEEMKMIAQERAAEEMAANGESPYYISSGNPIESIWEFAENVRRNLMFTKAWRKVTVADGENVSEHWEQKEGALPFDLTLFRLVSLFDFHVGEAGGAGSSVSRKNLSDLG
uniref:Uncharacterized protein n=1 Tax=Chromera velia CCMP2878 TaxID=1169474 RepID=A0A0G4HIW6_9ALVE|eukprot:Cvel_28083.t1-p1 / transcript=Cvel_28083.t1 / gene=Cvel_28083 / organism=Chromera_velia_CCMP2878 / gene_product=hypothetical protein / transcript_product=hypothetical protein / location=Cvel_scaffold3611:13372-15050(+) / protein_length=171 / sequence_SO=supercontig / SO=protein_coding / is_pseudo=false